MEAGGRASQPASFGSRPRVRPCGVATGLLRLVYPRSRGELAAVLLRRVCRFQDWPSCHPWLHRLARPPSPTLFPSAASVLYPASFRSPGLSSGVGLPAACWRDAACPERSRRGGSDSCRAPRGVLSRQASCVHGTLFAMPTATNHTVSPRGAWRWAPPQVDPLAGRETSPFVRRLVELAVPIVFTFVAVVMVPSVASHPASRRRGDFRFSPAQRQPVAEVSHLGRACSFTAHERRFPTAVESDARRAAPPLLRVQVERRRSAARVGFRRWSESPFVRCELHALPR